MSGSTRCGYRIMRSRIIAFSIVGCLVLSGCGSEPAKVVVNNGETVVALETAIETMDRVLYREICIDDAMTELDDICASLNDTYLLGYIVKERIRSAHTAISMYDKHESITNWEGIENVSRTLRDFHAEISIN